jgi:hypothetical protein
MSLRVIGVGKLKWFSHEGGGKPSLNKASSQHQ